MLPIGAICDRCQARVGSKVDAPFVTQGLGGMRSLFGIPGKAGLTSWKPPRSARFSGLGLDGRRVKLVSGTLSRPVDATMAAQPEAKTFEITIPEPSREVISRFMSRLLLAAIAAGHGPELARTAQLDRHRQNLNAGTLPAWSGPVPESAGMVPAWYVSVGPGHVGLELWGMGRFAIRADGRPPLSDEPNEFVLPIEPWHAVGSWSVENEGS